MIEIIRMEEHADEEVQTVEIELGEYAEMVWRDNLLTMMLRGLFKSASLSYRGDELSFSGTSVEQLLRYGFPERYKGRLAELKAEKASKDAEAEKDEMISIINLSDEDDAEGDE